MLSRHDKVVPGTTVYSCNFCPYRTVYKRRMEEHEAGRHTGNPPPEKIIQIPNRGTTCPMPPPPPPPPPPSPTEEIVPLPNRVITNDCFNTQAFQWKLSSGSMIF